VKVLKFGGGCLRDAAGFKRAAALAARETPRPAVVVSAVFGVTDLLISAVAAAAALKSSVSAFMPALRELHVRIAEETLTSRSLRPEVLRAIDGIGERADRLLRGIALVGEASPAVRAQVLSCGERLAAQLLAAVLEDRGVPARVYETDIIGLAADGGHEDAFIDCEASGPALAALGAEIESGDFVAVFTGFFGRAPDGRVATFGRNGSDYSAAAIARGLGAEAVEFWKDADGFMTADPRWVPEARPIARLSAAAAAELSYFGSRILHPRVFEPLEGAAIAVRIRNFAEPERPGTEIRPGAVAQDPAAICATANTEVAVIRVLGPGVAARPGIMGLIGSRLARAGVNILTVLTAQTAINLLVDRDDAEKSRLALAGTGADAIRSVEVVDDAAIVAVVGCAFDRTPGVAGRFFAALERAGINAFLVAGGASESAVYGVVKRGEARPAVRALHGEFFPDPAAYAGLVSPAQNP
jgi:aspartokinase/homoserine dehydrogenase 1